MYGFTGAAAGTTPQIEVEMLSIVSGKSYKVPAQINGSRWKAFLRPTAQGGNYNITARCVSGCEGSVAIGNATFGGESYLSLSRGVRCPRCP